jgi:hypothetical protein
MVSRPGMACTRSASDEVGLRAKAAALEAA